MSAPEAPDYRALLKRALLSLDEQKGKLDSLERSRNEPIAVIGLGCRFPRGSNDPEAFWRNLREGVDCVTEIPSDRWDLQAFYDPEPGAPGKMYARHGGFLDRVDGFDPHFFGIAPREAMSADPQQRVLLEVVWEALEHAGQAPATLAGSPTGVFIGIGSSDYAQLQTRSGDPDFVDTYFGSGMSHSVASGRLSYVLGLQGPSLSVDTACSSSLVALHLAAQSLRSGECRLAIAGGVNLILAPDGSIATSQARMLSPEGRCKTFDAGANGYVRAEGCGIVILKRLGDALANGDNVLALIRGSAVNQDGRSSGLTAPSGPAQEAVIREALAHSNLTGEKIAYVETHGTGTSLGDPIEVRALAAVLGPGRPEDRPLGIGGVKTNIGHLEAAAGIAGLLKAVLALHHEEIPPHLHFKTPNPHIPWGQIPVRVVTERTPFPRSGEPRFVGVSSFSFSGTNAHVILEEAPLKVLARESSGGLQEDVPERPQHLLTLSARTDTALRELAGRYETHLGSHEDVPLAEVCFTAGAGRSHFSHRLAARGATAVDVSQALAAFRAGSETPGLRTGSFEGAARPEIAFLFTGQGAQYAGMGRQLYRTQPTFRRTLDQCEEILYPLLREPLLSVLHPAVPGEGDRSTLDETAFTQPALFALEYALAELLRSWGIEPAVVMGHSVGEYVAACVAGLFTLEDGLHLIAERGRLMQGLPRGGEMAAVLGEESRVRTAVAGLEKTISIAAFNGPGNVVISGTGAAVREVLRGLEADGIKSRLLTVSHAFHSPLMDPMLDAFGDAAAKIEFKSPRLGIVSNVTGRMARAGEMATAAYWRRHVREGVRFAEGMKALHEQGTRVFVEIGPTPTLLAMGQRCLAGASLAWVPTLRKGKDDWTQLLDGLAQLYVGGGAVDWAAFDRDYPRRRVALPTYPFDRQRYWLDSATRGGRAPRASARGGVETGHPLLGVRLRSALMQTQFETEVSSHAPAFVADHAFYGQAVFPAAAYCEMALAAGRSVLGPGYSSLTDLSIEEPLVLPDGVCRTVQLILSPEGSFQIASLEERDEVWHRHASGKIRTAAVRAAPPEGALAAARGRCRTEMQPAAYYATFQEQGVTYGPAFQGIERLWSGEGEAVGLLRVPEIAVEGGGHYLVHPALLDAGFQLLGATFPAEDRGREVYMPTRIAGVTVHGEIGSSLWSHVTLLPQESAEALTADIRYFEEGGGLVLEVLGLGLRRARRETLDKAAPQRFLDWLYALEWRPQGAPSPATSAPGRWLVLADQGGIGEDLARRLRGRGDAVFVGSPGTHFVEGVDGHFTLDPRAPQDFERLQQAIAGDSPLRGVVHLWGLDAGESELLAAAEASLGVTCGSVLSLVQALVRAGTPYPPRLWLVTRGGQPQGPERVALSQAPLWGLARTIAIEHPGLRCTRVDLDPRGGGLDLLWNEIASEGEEDQVAFRAGERRVARLARVSGSRSGGVTTPEPMQLQIRTKGVLDNLTLEPMIRRPPGPGEVEIRVQATGLNFRDVLNALGLYPGDAGPLGNECAGQIVEVGDGVAGFKVGDEVMAMAPASFATHMTAGTDFVAHRPAGMDAADAATIPIAFLTAHYALNHLGHLRAGEKVLIHAAAGGVGMAAVQIAQRARAEVFATAGSDEKRDLLRSLGVPHVFDSRSLRFADEILALTGGRGVDLILNSLTGDFIPKSLDALAPEGRFLEIGKRGIWDAGQVAQVRPLAAYHIIYLGEVAERGSGFIREMLAELLPAFADGTLRTLPLRAFPLSQAADAFRYMAQAKHVGKVVVTQAAALEATVASARPREDGTYLITGGLTGLGLVTARWLVERGARNLVLLGRRAPSETALAAIATLEAEGATVVVSSTDVSDREAVRAVLERIAVTLPRLRGVIHAAGVLDDGVLVQQDWSRFEGVLAAKARGAGILHEETRDLPLDFFVLFSSVASLLGSPGQGNYATANAILDALAHRRRAEGLAALSVNWGAWAEVGMSAALGPRDQRRREEQGIGLIEPTEGVRALGRLMDQGLVQAAVLPVDWPRFLREFGGEAAVPPVYRELAEGVRSQGAKVKEEVAPAGGFLKVLEAMPEAERAERLLSHVREQVVKVLGLDPSRPPGLKDGLTDIGMDSLMAVELRNRLEASLGRSLPATLAYEHPTLARLSDFLGKEVLALTSSAASDKEDRRRDADLQDLSKDQLEASLLSELERAGY